MSRRRLFLLDGLAMAYRSHFAFIRRPLTNTRGEVTSAVFAFANTVVKLRANDGFLLGTFGVGRAPVGVAYDGQHLGDKQR